MVYLLLQVVFSSAFTLVIKWVQVREREDIITIGAINYIVALLAALPAFSSGPSDAISLGAVWTGASMGGVYFIAFFFAIYCIKAVGASSATVISVLSILFPISLAALIWEEIPSQMQVVGIAIALVALLLIGVRGKFDRGAVSAWIAPAIMIGFFLLCGLSRLSQDAFKHFSTADQRPTFLVAAFLVASIPSLGLLIYRRKKIRAAELGMGMVMGLANVLQSYFILKCLYFFPGYIVFPVTSAGGIVLTTIIATGMLEEKLSVRTYTGIGLSVIALFLLH